MLHQICVVFLLVTFSSIVIYGWPSRKGMESCFKHACPENTFGCSKRSNMTDDKKEIVSLIRCLGRHDKVLDSITVVEPNTFGDNPFPRHTYIIDLTDTDSNTGDDTNKDDEYVQTTTLISEEKNSEGNSEVKGSAH